jgi:O-antigen/teichoic acid export membrane protein
VSPLDRAMSRHGFLRNAAVYGGLSVLSRFSAVLTAPIVTSAFTVPEYGTLDTLNVVIAIAALVIGLNLDSGLFRLYYEKNAKGRRELLSTTLMIYLGFSAGTTALFAAAPIFASETIFGTDQYAKLLVYGMIRFPFMLAFQQMNSLLRIQERAVEFSLINLLAPLGAVSVVGVLRATDSLTLEGLVLGQSLVQVALTGVLFLRLRKEYGFTFNTNYAREVAAYALPNFPSLLINFIVMGSLPLLITKLSSSYDTGIYAVASRISTIFGIVVFAFRAAYDPMMMRLMAERSPSDFKETSSQSFWFYLTLLVPMLLFLYLVPHVFPLLIDEKFSAALPIVPIVTLATYLTGWQNIFGLGIAYTKRTKYSSYAQAIALIFFVVLARPLIGGYGYAGGAALFLISVSVQNMAVYAFSQRLMPVDYSTGAAVAGVVGAGSMVWLQHYPAQGGAILLAGIAAGWVLRRNRFLDRVVA